MIQCPRCGIQVTELHAPDSDFRMKAESTGEVIPSEICVGCMTDLRKMVASSSGGVLMAQERAKEQYRLNMWNNRVSLIKQARACMSSKMFSEAAVSYEKYLKILEIIFECKNGDVLKPELFKESARTAEITVVACVYWDLLKIYDSHDRYAQRQMIAAQQLGKFIQFSPIFPDIVKRAQNFQRQAKNPGAVKAFLKHAAVQRPRCFIATCVYEDTVHADVLYLRHVRDLYLRQSMWGRRMIWFYYQHSPQLAEFLDHHALMRVVVRKNLQLFTSVLRFFLANFASK